MCTLEVEMDRSFNRCRLIGMALTCAVMLAACGTPTAYQPASKGLGYAEQAIEDDRYRVTFAGNSLTTRETVETYLLYRAAEVTLERGYDHFLVVDEETERSTTYHSTITGLGGHRAFHSYHYGYPFGISGIGTATVRPRDRYTAFANIVMRDGPKPVDDPVAYDARDVLERLGPTIIRGQAS